MKLMCFKKNTINNTLSFRISIMFDINKLTSPLRQINNLT